MAVVSRGQDAAFSQIMAVPLQLNPAMSGAYEGTFRLSTLYRSQWNNLLEDAYRTYYLSGDARLSLNSKAIVEDYIGVGVQFYSDNMRTYDFTNNSILVSAAFHKTLSQLNNNILSIGFQAGMIQKNFTYQKFTFQDQFNGVNDFSFTTAETLPLNNYSYLDFSTGINYSGTIGAHSNTMVLGMGFFHVNTPNISFYQNESNIDENILKDIDLNMRMTFYSLFDLDLNKFWSISPRVVAQMQGKHLRIEPGSGFRYEMSESFENAVHFGLYGRLNNSLDKVNFTDLILMAGIETNGLFFGLSYDILVGGNRKVYQRGQNSFEVSLRYIGKYEDNGVYCPKF